MKAKGKIQGEHLVLLPDMQKVFVKGNGGGWQWWSCYDGRRRLVVEPLGQVRLGGVGATDQPEA